jgi:hypothetical protein
MRDNNLEPDAIEGVLRESFEPLTYRQALPALRRHWQAVLRDACTRTNAALVRPVHLAFFEEFI